MSDYTFDVYTSNGGKYSTKFEWCVDTYLKDISHSDTTDDLEYIDTVPPFLKDVFVGNVRIATIHKHKTPTVDSVMGLLNIDFEEWVKSEPINKLKFPDEIVFEFCDKHKGLDFLFDELEERVREIKNNIDAN